jgi:hypothetical protein
MNNSKYKCFNTYNTNTIIGRSWSINEHYDMIRLILNLKHNSQYVGDEYENYDQIKDNIIAIRNEFHNIEGIIIENSSLKYYTNKDNKLVHNVMMRKQYVEHIVDQDYFIQKIIDLLPDKKIIFVSHFLHTKIVNRLVICQCLQKYVSKNVILIIPSLLWENINPLLYLRDENHYRVDKEKVIANYIDNILDKLNKNIN